ncbi:MAG: agmatine deiminase family protein [Prevotella sp.]|nr:agmatine deiminase family protein [Prevotella sp.]
MNNYILPAEWHRQEAVIITWPHEDTDWRDYLDEITATMVQMAKAIAKHERLIIAAQYPERLIAKLDSKLNADEMLNVGIYRIDNDDTWARDHGFITLLPENGSGKRKLLDFRFNGWGEKFAAEKDNEINANLFEQGAIAGEYEDNLDFVLEGGSIESDGKGTVFTTSQCLLAPNRNQPMDKEQIEVELKKRLHAERVVWLDYGNLIGDDTDGHIDTIVRVCPDDTLLYIKCDDKDDEQYADFKKLEDQLKTLRTIDGKPYKLVALPFTKAISYDGERLPATYANFLIINDAVIVPTYNQEEADRKAMDTIAKVFPDREIIGIGAGVIIRQHGSIHCLTMQVPV